MDLRNLFLVDRSGHPNDGSIQVEKSLLSSKLINAQTSKLEARCLGIIKYCIYIVFTGNLHPS